MKFSKLSAVVMAVLTGAVSAQSSGTYTTDTGYSITVEVVGSTLVIKEPNKESTYRLVRPGVYRFDNPNNKIAYALVVEADRTLIASKFDESGNVLPHGTRLNLESGKLAKQDIRKDAYKNLETVALNYLERAKSDPANAQAWSFCGMAAMARAHGNNDAQVLQAASALKMMTTAPQSPCPDAITSAVWNSAP
jgi:hypothetical protein